MDRIIKFRGKALDYYETSQEEIEKGDWVYGYFTMFGSEANIITKLSAD